VTRKRPFGTAQQEVLLKLYRRRPKEWTTQDPGLFDNSRELTTRVCDGLTDHGYVSRTIQPGVIIYTMTGEGVFKAEELSMPF
jgi:hypothetical protein